MRFVATFKPGAIDALLTKLKGFEGQAGLAGMLNAAGAGVRRETVVAETKQTGLQSDTIERAQKASPASPGRLAYTIRSGGGNVRLKYFGAKEEGGGVLAHPWNSARFYPGAWIDSGFGSDRAPSPRLHGQVFSRTGSRRLPIKQVRSGLFIPTEMTRDQTASAFEAGARSALLQIQTRVLGMFDA